MLSQNDSMKIDFQEFTLDVDDRSIVGQAVLAERPINIPDLTARQPSARPVGLRHNRSFDEKTGLPRALDADGADACRRHGEVIGVVQLINKPTRAGRCSATPTSRARWCRSTSASEELALALAAQAGIALENALLYDEIRDAVRGLRRRLGHRDRVARSDDVGSLAARRDA